ncbi:MAG: ribosome biogenesis GTP-binding protein YihA/YsxC [candidate division KSB1 bacterium]|nr:ribosome biogenesis GTP-binding protein YihA/YsxC [candidate division KSB1 bacterium]MDZ7369287.1 ribosome biogenesis GTP-binding protein YihA/YsxC [candidate division KSB1 bacterium]MDZ7407321.1 ribosome biogenesis GTP-binding protein YihA/YsxC [candidate division KSB1 bacterium]
MTIKDAELVLSVAHAAQLPQDGLPQIAVCGRSNVGKSSLINSLLNRRHLAKTSNQPGKTRLLNFFRLTPATPSTPPFYFVDLPGYGYAKVSHTEREQWRKLIEVYFKTNRQLRGVMALIDSRHGPLENDLELLTWLAALRQRIVVVATKADKLSNHQRAGRKREIAGSVSHLPITALLFYSATTALGKKELWQTVNALIRDEVFV